MVRRGKGSDRVREDPQYPRLSAPKEVAIVRPFDPSAAVELWGLGRVRRWRYSGRKAPSAVAGVQNQLVAEAPSSSEGSKRGWRQGWGFSVNLALSANRKCDLQVSIRPHHEIQSLRPTAMSGTKEPRTLICALRVQFSCPRCGVSTSKER